MTPSRILAIAVLAIVGGAVLVTSLRPESESGAGDVAIASQAAAPVERVEPVEEGAQSATGSADADVVDAADEVTSTIAPDLGEAPPVLGAAGTLVELDGWLNADYTSLEEIDAPVRVVQFWTFGCINCKRTLESMRALYDDHGEAGLEVIGVHSPEFEREKDPVDIAAAAEDLGVNWPIALDTEKKNFRTWQGSRRFWPRTYVLDADGNIRFDHIGEGKYDELRQTVEWLLANEA